MTKASKVNLFAYSLSLIVIGLAFYVWGETYSWRFSNMNALKLFPLFGLIAFSVMWSHYAVGAVRRYFGASKQSLQKYFDITAGIVLVAILLHPGLLWWQLWRDGGGLPPGSVLNIVPETLKTAVIMGMVALVVFLTFELHRFYGKKSWWKYFEYASILAMGIIFVHAIRLGGAINGWFMVVWIYYGITLVMAVAYTYYFDYQEKQQKLLKSSSKKPKPLDK